MPDSSSPQTRPSLILRLRSADDLTAWREFVEIYQPVVFSLARNRGLQTADADDVTQEVLSRVARAIADWDPSPEKGSFRAWLATITRNQVIQFFREHQRRPAVNMDSQTRRLLPAPDTEEQEFDLAQERELFLWAARRIQKRFEPVTWQAFWRTAVDGIAVLDVATDLGITRAQVYVARSRVMARLKATLQSSNFDTAFSVKGQS